jgi:hypothetical protein
MITRNARPCWEATCDYCGAGDNYESGGSYHYPDEKELLDALASYDWTIVQNPDTSVKALYCSTCWDEFSDSEREERAA